jgi:hypothetical protein
MKKCENVDKLGGILFENFRGEVVYFSMREVYQNGILFFEKIYHFLSMFDRTEI